MTKRRAHGVGRPVPSQPESTPDEAERRLKLAELQRGAELACPEITAPNRRAIPCRLAGDFGQNPSSVLEFQELSHERWQYLVPRVGHVQLAEDHAPARSEVPERPLARPLARTGTVPASAP